MRKLAALGCIAALGLAMLAMPALAAEVPFSDDAPAIALDDATAFGLCAASFDGVYAVEAIECLETIEVSAVIASVIGVAEDGDDGTDEFGAPDIGCGLSPINPFVDVLGVRMGRLSG